ncbi:hypothetical protein DSO57_1022299, partial [Entomophthora muscae]
MVKEIQLRYATNVELKRQKKACQPRECDSLGFQLFIAPTFYQYSHWSSCFVLASPEAITTPACLKESIVPSDPQWYFGQIPSGSIISESSTEIQAFLAHVFQSVKKALPWSKDFPVLPVVPKIGNVNSAIIIQPSFGVKVVKFKIVMHKVKVLAILDTCSPVNVVSTQLMRKLKMTPDVDYFILYETCRTSSTQSIGAYYSLPLRFGKLVLTAPAIVLENKNYDFLVGKKFPEEFDGIINTPEKFLTLFRYHIPLHAAPEIYKGPQKRCSCLLEQSTDIPTLHYH